MNFASKIGRFFFVVVIVSFLLSPLVSIQVSHAQSDDGALSNQSHLFLPLVTGNGLAGQANEQASPSTIGQTQADNGPIHDDEYWATLTENEPRWEPTGQVRAALATNVGGEWGPVIPWPHTPVSMANLPDGRVLTWSGSERQHWPSTEQTYSAAWDPATGQFSEYFNDNHNMFCAALLSLDDGRVMAIGGRNTTVFTSIFDGSTNKWTRVDNLNNGRWYPTALTLADGSAFTTVGRGGPYPERWSQSTGWTRLTGINLQAPILDYGANKDGAGWWPLMHLDPRGNILHYGATPVMHSLNPNGNGSLTVLGNSNFSWFPEESVAVMYDEGKILVAGGAQSSTTNVSSDKAAIIDVNNPVPQITTVGNMFFARQFANEVVLADGTVLVTGGNTSGQKFSDNGTVLDAELWDPATQAWTLLNPMAVPRNYHSTAILLPDARVLTGGGGYASGNPNHPATHTDGQVFSPPYLFRNTGTLAARPTINNAPGLIAVGQTFGVSGSNNITRFTMVRNSAATHTMNTDQRFLDVDFIKPSNGNYRLTVSSNPNVLLPGYWMLFGLKSNGVPSVAKMVHVKAKTLSIGAIADRFDLGETTVSLQVSAQDEGGNSLTFSAVNLPEGLSINASTGLISGVIDPGVSGQRNVTISVSNALVTETTQFVWSLSPSIRLTLAPLSSAPSEVGTALSYTALYSGGSNPQFKWLFGDGSAETAYATSPSASHTFSQPGLYEIKLTAKNGDGSTQSITFSQSIYTEQTATRSTNSSNILYQTNNGADYLWNVNPDNNSVAVTNVDSQQRIDIISVGQNPSSLAQRPDSNSIWVVNSDSATISIIDSTSRSVVNTVSLPRGSKPFGIVFDSGGYFAYVALEALGEVVRIDLGGRNIAARVDVGPHVRHLAITPDNTKLLVSRFITPPLAGESSQAVQANSGGGEVLMISLADMSLERTIRLQVDNGGDFEAGARGVPNYLAAPVLSPDGQVAWVPSKQDNVLRGGLRDGLDLNFEHTVRAISSYIDLSTNQERFAFRLDHDNAAVASAATFGRYGNYLFVTLETSREVAVIDAFSRRELFRFDTGRAPQGITISPDGMELYVYNFMDRSIGIYNLTALMTNGTNSVSLVKTITTVSNELLAGNILAGKQLFYDARDTRLTMDRYMSCASCHNAGDSDGRVWDLTADGEGLRNTISLVGHGGPEHGRLHWSANFDEVHDFEGQIRSMAGGTGLMATSNFNATSAPLGAPKAGLSADLDALAAYVNSLTTVGDSPYRNADGTLTADAVAGKAVFQQQNCASCHAGVAFTDSSQNVSHNIGTLKPSSGSRLGGSLTGLDTPTLLGLWATAPYLHDGSAATLAESINAHSGVSLGNAQMNQLVAYLQQIDDNEQGQGGNGTITLDNPGSQTNTVGDSVGLTITATDSDGDTLTFSAAGLPAGLAIDRTTGMIGGLPTTAGAYQVTVNATDGATNESVSFEWTVDEEIIVGNPVPIYTDAIATNWSQGNWSGVTVNLNNSTPVNVGTKALSFRYDDGSSTLFFQSSSALAATTYQAIRFQIYGTATNQSFNVSILDGTFQNSPPVTVTATPNAWKEVTIPLSRFGAVSDILYILFANPQSTSQPIIYLDELVLIDNNEPVPPNNAPILTNPGSQTNEFGASINLPINGTDADGDSLTYTASGLPSGLSINRTSGVISGSLSRAGNFNGTVIVEDGQGGAARVSFSWRVNGIQPPTDADQILAYTLDRSAVPTLFYNELTLNVVTGPADRIMVAADGNVIAHSFNAATGATSFTTSGSDIKVYLNGHGSPANFGAIEAAQLKNNKRFAWSIGFDDNTGFIPAIDVLNEFGYRGSVFAITNFIDDTRVENWIVDAPKMRELLALGWSIAPHGRTANCDDHNVADTSLAFDRIEEIVSQSAVPSYLVTSFAAPCFIADYHPVILQLRDGNAYDVQFNESGDRGLMRVEQGVTTYLSANNGRVAFPLNLAMQPTDEFMQIDRNDPIGRDLSIESDLNGAKATIDWMAANATNGKVFWMNMFQHGSDGVSLRNLLTHMQSNYGDDVLVAPSDEVYSYLLVRDLTVINGGINQ